MTQKIVALTAAAWLVMGHGAAFAAEFSVERPGDADMSCEALAGEITTLSTAQAKAAERAAKGRRLLGFATSAMQVAAPLVTGGLVRDAAAAGARVGEFLKVRIEGSDAFDLMAAPVVNSLRSGPAGRMHRVISRR